MATIRDTISPSFSCELCKTITSNKKDYNKHLLTRKHVANANPQQVFSQKSPTLECGHCNKLYESRSGLWRHMKTCNTTSKEPPQEDVKSLTSLVLELMKSNTELQKQLVDVCKNSNTNSHNTSHINSHNKTFNLQYFLNERCKMIHS